MTLGRRNLIIEPLCLFRVECQRELRGPVQLMTRVRHCVIAVTRTGQTLSLIHIYFPQRKCS